MPHSPLVRYFAVVDGRPIEANDRVLAAPLPQSLREQAGEPVTFGSYFEALSAVLSQNQWEVLCQAVEQFLGLARGGFTLSQVDLTAEKHGALYHPARVRVEGLAAGEHFNLELAANLALTTVGRRAARQEHRILCQLHQMHSRPALPRPAGFGETRTRGLDAALLLTEWLSGFHEFHQSSQAPAGTLLHVWDGGGTPRFLDQKQSARVFFRASEILSLYYNPFTDEQIHPWHHAAGDFVVDPGKEEPRVRLITARGYGPLFSRTDSSPEFALQSALYFLANLSMRMRLDADEGTGRLLWAPDFSVESCVEGFFSGLSLGEQNRTGSDAFAKQALTALRRVEPMAWVEALADLLGACDPRSPDVDFLASRLPGHAEILHAALQPTP